MCKMIRVLTPSEIPCFHEVLDDYNSIELELNSYIKTLEPKISIHNLGDWKFLINIMMQRSNAIGISKRTARYPSDKEFEIYISIPIPDDVQVAYGVACVREAFFKGGNEKYSYILEPNYEKFDNLYDYILESSKLAIDVAFTKGFTCNGKKLQFQKC